MLRSLALSLAASTAAQFLHANQPTDPPSTHRLTNHPTPPLCHLVHPQSPHTPVSLPLTASNASPSSLWTATFAHVSSPPLSFSLRLPPPLNRYSSPFPSSFSTDNLRSAHFFSFGSSSLLSYLYYALFTDEHPSIRMFLFPFFLPFVSFFFANRARFFLRNKIIRRSFRGRLTLRVEGGEEGDSFGLVWQCFSPSTPGREGGEENWSVARCVKTAWMKNTIDFSTLGGSRDTASSLCIVTSFLGYIQNWPDISKPGWLCSSVWIRL